MKKIWNRSTRIAEISLPMSGIIRRSQFPETPSAANDDKHPQQPDLFDFPKVKPVYSFRGREKIPDQATEELLAKAREIERNARTEASQIRDNAKAEAEQIREYVRARQAQRDNPEAPADEAPA
jgi:hypothetical protein